MSLLRRRPHPRALLALLLLAAAVAGLAATSHSRAASSSDSLLRARIDAEKAKESTLAGALARLGVLERRTAKEVALLQGRLNDAQTAFSSAQSRLEETRTKLRAAKARVVRLKLRLTRSQEALGSLLVSRYEDDPPDLVTVVLHSDGFRQLLETLDFAKRVQDRDADVLGQVRTARTAALAARTQLSGLEGDQAEETEELQQRRDQAQQLTTLVAARQAALQQATAARQQALDATRASRHANESALAKQKAAEARAALKALEAQQQGNLSHIGPGGPWAIPWAVVQCESGGQDLPPNYASASGYYQFLDSTWKGLGGSTQHAYQAPKSEQDALAAKLWDGGRGARNWVCAYIVGIV